MKSILNEFAAFKQTFCLKQIIKTISGICAEITLFFHLTIYDLYLYVIYSTFI